MWPWHPETYTEIVRLTVKAWELAGLAPEGPKAHCTSELVRLKSVSWSLQYASGQYMCIYTLNGRSPTTSSVVSMLSCVLQLQTVGSVICCMEMAMNDVYIHWEVGTVKLKVTAPIATPSYVEILQSAYMAIGAIYNQSLHVHEGISSFVSFPKLTSYLCPLAFSTSKMLFSLSTSCMDSAENFVCCWIFFQANEESQNAVYREGMMEWSLCNFCTVTTADNSSQDTSACSMGDNSQSGEW